MDKKLLYRYWKEYINRNIYRVISSEYTEDIKQNGLDPSKDPFKGVHKKINSLFDIVLRLEKQKLVYEGNWGRPVKGSYIIKTSRQSMDHNYIDLVADYKQAQKFKRLWKGGALTHVVSNFCGFLKDKSGKLSQSDKELVEWLSHWAVDKQRYKNNILFVRATSEVLESAKFHYLLRTRKKQNYYPSPYGSFEHFKNVIQQQGFKKYEAYLKGEKLFYIRVVDKIPAQDICKII